VHFGEVRLREAQKFGFRRAVIPSSLNMEIEGVEVVPVASLKEAVEALL